MPLIFRKMKQRILVLLLFSINIIAAQQEMPTKSINGTYYLLFSERGVKTKHIQFGENNGTQLLAIAACEKCMPAVYTYKPKESKELEKPVFYNSIGLYVISYDAESFITVMLSTNENTNFAFSNFYSKNPATIKTMTKEKIEAYAMGL